MSAISLEHLIQALDGFYSTQDATQRHEFGSYLEEFQKSTEAWGILHKILAGSLEEYPVPAKVFCAQTLRSKISYDLHQVPKEARVELKNSVVELLKHNISLRGVPRTVGIQLSVVLADLALQILEWKDVVKEMVQTFGGSNESLPCLLEFLKVLPEELLNPRHTLLTDEEYNMRSEELLDRNANEVVHLLIEYAKNAVGGGSSRSGTATPSGASGVSAIAGGVGGSGNGGGGSGLSEDTLVVLYECLNSWLKEISIEDFLGSDLFNILFIGLNDDGTFEGAVECICSVIKETRDNTNLNLIGELYPRIVGLREKIVDVKDDSNLLIGLTKVFSEAGESWHVLVAQSPNDFLDLIECIIDCVKVDEELDAISYTFYFWYTLKQMIVMEKYADSRRILADVYLRLISIIIERLKYPSGDVNSDLFNGNREDEEKFRLFRHDIGDVLKDCCEVVGSSKALGESYKALVASLGGNSDGSGVVTPTSTRDWQSIEAPLFSVRAMGQVVDLNEDSVLPNIMSQLLSLPENNKIRYTATLLLGRYTEWTAKHPQYLDFQLDYIIKGFDNNDNDVNKASAQALMFFCQDCRDLLAKYIEQLHPFYEKMLNILDIQSLYQVTEGIAYIIKSQPEPSILIALQHFTKPIVQKLIDLTKSEGNDQVYRSIADIIELLTIFIRYVRPDSNNSTTHPTTQFIFEVFPIVPPLIQAHGTSSFVAERCSKFIKYCLHSSGSGLRPILSTIGNLLANEFDRTKFGCYLWVSGALVSEFNKEEPNSDSPDKEKNNQFIWEFCKHQSYSFFRILSNTNPKDIPDLIEDYFHLSSDILMYYPQLALTSDWITTTFQASLAALTLEQFDPLIATLHFLLDLFAYSGEKSPSSVIPGGEVPPEIRTIVINLATSQGEQLTTTIITGILFSYPRDVITDASSLLLSVYKISNGQQAIQWLSSALNTLPPSSLSTDEKQKLLHRISVSMESQDFKRVRSILRDFTTLYSRRNLTPRNAGLTASVGTFSFSG